MFKLTNDQIAILSDIISSNSFAPQKGFVPSYRCTDRSLTDASLKPQFDSLTESVLEAQGSPATAVIFMNGDEYRCTFQHVTHDKGSFACIILQPKVKLSVEVTAKSEVVASIPNY